MQLSVVILNYNVCFFLEQCILSVQRAIIDINAEIIVIDNNSQDGSKDMVAAKFPEITWIQNTENVGFSTANNQAVAVAKGEYLCILNPDTAVEEDTFSRCLTFAHTTSQLGAIGVQLFDGTGNFLPESKRNVPTPKASLLKLIGFGKSYYARKVGQHEIAEVGVLVGAFMFLKRSVYEEVGGFDEDYFMYGEDIDLSYKLTKAGYQNYYLGTTSVLHYKGESTLKDAAYLNRFYGAMEIFYQKHFSSNVVQNTLVKIAVVLAKTIRGSKKRRVPSNTTVEETIVLTEDLGLLKELSETLNIEVRTSSKAIFQDALIKNTCFIFDVNYMPYSQIFSVMKQLQNSGNQFRICPPNTNFIIGSDTSDEKGSVQLF